MNINTYWRTHYSSQIWLVLISITISTVFVSAQNPIFNVEGDIYAGKSIDIDTNEVVPSINFNSGTSNVTFPKGIIYDSGGPDGNYDNNESLFLYFDIPDAALIQLLIQTFETESNNDYMLIQGDTLTGTLANSSLTIPSNSSIRFRTNGSNTEEGFKIWFEAIATTNASGLLQSGLYFNSSKNSLAVGSGWPESMGSQSLSFGSNNETSSSYSYAIGDDNTLGSYSSAIGFQNSLPSRSFVMGRNNTLNTSAYVIGDGNRINSSGAIGAFGEDLRVNSSGGIAIGSGNEGYDSSVLEVGKGDVFGRENAVTVFKDESVGFLEEDGILVIGDVGSANIIIDGDEILARNGFSQADLRLNMTGNARTRINNPYLHSVETTGSYNLLRFDPSTGRVFYESSTKKDKTNISAFKDDWTKILQAEPRKYNRIHDQNRLEIGYIAEDMDQLGLSHLVTYDKDGIPTNFDYLKMVVYLTEILKLHEVKLQEIDHLERQIKKLTRKVEGLKRAGKKG